MRHTSILRYLLMLAICVCFLCTSAEAAVPESQVQGDLQQLVLQWHQEQPKDAVTASALLQYALRKQASSPTTVKPSQNSILPRYQAIYKLPSGAWVMGFMPDPSGNLSTLVDLNPGAGGSERATGFSVKRFLLNPSTGQVVSIRPLGMP